MELDAISQPDLEQLERFGSADLVIGVLGVEPQEEGRTAVAMAREVLGKLSKPLRAMVVCNNGAHSPAAAQPEPPGEDQAPTIASYSLPLASPGETAQQSISRAYRTVFAIGGKLGARACAVVASPPETATRQWIYKLVQPVLDLGFDLVAPCYTFCRADN